LKDVIEEGQSDLLDFLADDSEDAVFEMNWDDAVFKATIKPTDSSYLPYPSY
jgi:DNA-3-methyladenine glycosylase